jgi:16S rRNA (guanine1207-N2)-methyltransferase
VKKDLLAPVSRPPLGSRREPASGGEEGVLSLFAQLGRAPDVEAPDLVAVDATDRLLLDTAAELLARCGPGEVVVVDDNYGALTLGAVALHGAGDVRVHQDLLVGELALARNAERTRLTGTYRSLPLGPELAARARLVLVQAPKGLEALREIAEVVAASAAPDVTVLVGGRVKHMTHAMNDVLRGSFGEVSATLARQKSRVLIAREPRPGPSSFPRCQHHDDLDLTVCASGAAFAGSRIDIGTRALLRSLDRMATAGTALDLGCGTGVLAAALARSRPALAVLAVDQSAAAVASATATAAANGLADRIRVVRDDAAASVAAGSVDLVVCNPPFHVGAAVVTTAADRLFSAATRVLRPGGELWTVYNSSLRYKPVLARIVGPTKVVDADAKFTVTVSTRR